MMLLAMRHRAAQCALLLLLAALSLSEKSFHRRSPHNAKYNFNLLTERNPDLKPFVKTSRSGDDSSTIDFSNSKGVLELNRALLSTFYNVTDWHLGEDSLLPPVPSRADYVYHILDLLPAVSEREYITGLDIGTGASCIYPLIATSLSLNSRNIRMVGSEVNAISFNVAQKNAFQRGEAIEIRKQDNSDCIFDSIIQQNDFYDFSMCNPPFYKSAKDQVAASDRKNKNLKIPVGNSNFRGMSHELYCNGGELKFIDRMIKESVRFKSQVGLFTSLISSNEHIPLIARCLEKLDEDVKYDFVEMNTGNKQTRFVTWTYTL